MLYKGLDKLVEFDSMNGIESSITTKAGRSEKVIIDVCKAGLNKATISLDAPDSKMVDYLLNSKGSYNNILHAIELFSKYSVDIRINMIATHLNYNMVSAMVYFCKKKEIESLSIRECKSGVGRNVEKRKNRRKGWSS